jgi:hypothetical protein
MRLLNLTPGELAIVAVAGIILIAFLYLEGRLRRTRVVSSVQFWALVADGEARRGGHRIREVASLLLQLLCFLALLLAVARPEWGSHSRAGNSHVLLLDTSAWTLQNNGQVSILDREKELVRDYIATLPAADKVMLVRVDGLVVPLTPFTTDRTLVRQRLSEAGSSLLALDLHETLAFAKQANVDIVYAGPARVSDATESDIKLPNLRVLPVEVNPSHCGISRVGLARGDEARSDWKMMVVLRNYGVDACDVSLEARVSGVALPPRQDHLASGEDSRAEYRFAGSQSERLELLLTPEDGLGSDHHVALELPGPAQMRVAVYTSRPEVIRNLAQLIPEASISLHQEDELPLDSSSADLIILDGLSLATPAQIPTLWIAPVHGNPPFPVQTSVLGVRTVSWNSRSPVAQGLHNDDLPLSSAKVYKLAQDDTPVLSIQEGPIVVVRPAQGGYARRAILGFDPANEKVRYEMTVPLLFMNLVRWLVPQGLAPARIEIGHGGAGQIELADGDSLEGVELSGNPPPALLALNQQVQFFAAEPGLVGFLHQGRNTQRAIALPEIAEAQWKPSQHTVATSSTVFHPQVDLWRWLVLAGLAISLLEWWLFASSRNGRRP